MPIAWELSIIFAYGTPHETAIATGLQFRSAAHCSTAGKAFLPAKLPEILVSSAGDPRFPRVISCKAIFRA